MGDQIEEGKNHHHNSGESEFGSRVDSKNGVLAKNLEINWVPINLTSDSLALNFPPPPRPPPSSTALLWGGGLDQKLMKSRMKDEKRKHAKGCASGSGTGSKIKQNRYPWPLRKPSIPEEVVMRSSFGTKVKPYR